MRLSFAQGAAKTHRMAKDNRNALSRRIQALVDDFGRESDWENRYKRVIDMGKNLPPLPATLRDEKYKVKGCQSQVWLHAELSPDGFIVLHADSDAVIVRGLVAVLVYVFSGARPDEILQTKPTFLADIGFDTHLSPSRANGLNAMIKQIYLYAAAFQALAAARGL